MRLQEPLWPRPNGSRSRVLFSIEPPKSRRRKAPGAPMLRVWEFTVCGCQGLSPAKKCCSNDDETLTIRHVTTSRRAFVPGVIQAIHAAATLDRLIVGL